ncbi:hypothetical protein ACFYYR_09305 [Streptomyces sp. NPDC001922]|uniref:hypothetical protein n=1 Tax=Streptomyces sp. NPDC001922 TaxID=3364624 RepID=UPI003695F6FD
MTGPGSRERRTRRRRRAGRSARSAVAAPALALVLALGGAGCAERPTTHHKPGTRHDVADGPAGRLLTADDGDGHRLRDVPARGAPAVTVTVRPDAEDGWNVRLDVRRFRFTPDSVGGAAVPGGGHAHLLLDGRKLARVYGRWHHLPAAGVPAGRHTLTARLYADDHTAWAVRGRPVQGTARLTATAAGSGHGRPSQGHGHHHPPESGRPSSDGGPGGGPPATGHGRPRADRTITVRIADGRVSPRPGRIELRKGRRIALRVTSDTDDELHVHGIDRSAALRAGRTTTLTVVLDRTGLFEVETHGSGLLLAQLAVR